MVGTLPKLAISPQIFILLDGATGGAAHSECEGCRFEAYSGSHSLDPTALAFAGLAPCGLHFLAGAMDPLPILSVARERAEDALLHSIGLKA